VRDTRIATPESALDRRGGRDARAPTAGRPNPETGGQSGGSPAAAVPAWRTGNGRRRVRWQDGDVTTRAGPIAQALRIAAEDEARLRADLDRARRTSGLSVADVGRACGLSRTATSRALAGDRPTRLREYAAIGAAVGLDVRLRAYPAGDPIRDAGQQRLLERLRTRINRGLRWRTEVTLPIEGDLRAWDATISGPDWTLPVEAETVIDDIQALERRLGRKQRDGGADHLLLLVADTRRNRRAVTAAPASLLGFDRDARAILRALGEGHAPGTSALVIL
jgi:hypothetical protein